MVETIKPSAKIHIIDRINPMMEGFRIEDLRTLKLIVNRIRLNRSSKLQSIFAIYYLMRISCGFFGLKIFQIGVNKIILQFLWIVSLYPCILVLPLSLYSCIPVSLFSLQILSSKQYPLNI